MVQVTQILAVIEKKCWPSKYQRYCSFRIGKYNDSNKCPRPVLVKLARSYDVPSILTSTQNLSKGILICKLDLPSAEQALLMKVRQQLIQSGQNKKDIKNTWQ